VNRRSISASGVAIEQAIFSSKCHLPVILLMLGNMYTFIAVGTRFMASYPAAMQRLSVRCWGVVNVGLAPGFITMVARLLDPAACAERNWVHRARAGARRAHMFFVAYRYGAF
jgi:hypothetical protein